MKSSHAFCCTFGMLLCVAAVSAGPADELNLAYSNHLVVGRSYLKDFPATKTKKALVSDYLGTDANGLYLGSGDNFPDLSKASLLAADVRTQMGGGDVDSDFTRARYVAWEALEALMNGQLFAGNSDLLNGLRVAFPISANQGPPGTTRPLPIGVPRKDDGNEYAGANLINLGYARLHFLRGIAATLDWMVSDPEGRLRAVDRLIYPQAPNYTAYSFDAYLPTNRFKDSNFPTAQGSQTAAYLYGNLLNRFGIANVSIADRLWRAAYFGAPNRPLRGRMLDEAGAELRRGIHAQFLAALPLAATLPDGNTAEPDGTLPENEYQVARLEQVKSSVESAVNLMGRIARGESPKLDNLRLNVDDTELQTQIDRTASLLNSLESAHTTANSEIQRLDQANVEGFQDVVALRGNYSAEMKRICGDEFDPTRFGGLATPANRQAYKDAIQAAFDARMKADLNTPSLVDGSEMGKAAINVLRAYNDIDLARVEMESIPQQIRIEEDRNRDVNTTVTVGGYAMSSVQVAIAVAESQTPKPLLGFPVSGVILDPSPLTAAPLQHLKNLLAIAQETTINSVNSRATIRNLLLRQRELAARMPSVVAQARLAIAEMNSLHKRILRLADDYAFYQDGIQQLWYNDPSVVFEQSKAELEYQSALQAAVVQLYLLSQKLGSRWTEDYQNPVRLANGSSFQPLGPENYEDFTEPESAFTIADHVMAKKMYRALKAWHDRLRIERPSPLGTPFASTVSLRQDLLGLTDYEWNEASGLYVKNPERERRNVALFRAYLLNSQKQNASKHAFELEFGINYFSPRRSTVTGTFSSPLFSSDANNWNHRLTRVRGRVTGVNVTQDAKVPFTLYQYGKIYNQGYFNRNDAARVDNLPLYYTDPRSLAANVSWDGVQQMRLNAGLVQDGPPTELTGSGISLFCDRYLLVIVRSELSSPVNLQNISDILITFEWQVGPPPTFVWPAAP